MHLFIFEWLTLVRQERRYDRLGLGKESRRAHRMETVFTEWFNALTIRRTLCKWEIRDNKRLLEYVIEVWVKLIEDMGRQHELQKWGIRSFMQTVKGLLGAIFHAWHEVVTKMKHDKALVRRQHFHHTSSVFHVWKDHALQIRKNRHTVQTFANRIWFKGLHAAIAKWAFVWRRKKMYRKMLARCLANSNMMSMFNALDRWRKLQRSQRILKRGCAMFRHACIYTTFSSWAASAKEFGRDVRLMRKKWNRIMLHRFFLRWYGHKTFSRWACKVLVQISDRSDAQILLAFFEHWKKWRSSLNHIRRVFGSVRRESLLWPFRGWHSFTLEARRMHVVLVNVLMRWCHKSVRETFNEWHEITHMIRAARILMNNQAKRSDIAVLRRSIRDWVQAIVQRRLARRATGRFLQKSLARAYDTWHSLVAKKKAKVRSAEKCFSVWFWKSMRGESPCLCLRRSGCVSAGGLKEMICGHGLTTLCLPGAFVELCLNMYNARKTRRVLRKGGRRLLRQTFDTWQCNAVFEPKRLAKIVRIWQHMTMIKVWRSWLHFVLIRKMAKKTLRVIQHAKQYRCVRSWANVVDQARVSKTYLQAVYGKVLSNSRQSAGNVFRRWVEKHIRDKRICEHAQLRCQKHMLASWRRILVVERIFRQRTYNILPRAVLYHDWLLARHMTRAWQTWARRTRSLSVKLQRFENVCCRRLVRGVYVALSHLVQTAGVRVHLADLQARRGLRLLAARSLYHWLMEVKTSREEALVQDRVVKGVKTCETSNFMVTCGNVVRFWATWTVSRQMHRQKIQMIRKLERRNSLRTNFQKYVDTLRTQKRHQNIVLRRHLIHCHGQMKFAFACIARYTTNGRIVRSIQARRLRLFKSKLLRIWTQTAGIVNLTVNFDKQRYRTYNFCMHQRCKRSVMRFMHQWMNFLDHRRSWNKFIQRIARKRLSQMLHAWRSAMVATRIFERTVQASDYRWLSNRMHEWKRSTAMIKEHDDGKVQYLREIHVRTVVREWTKRANKKKYKYDLMLRLIKRRERVMLQRSWKSWSGAESHKIAMPFIVKCMTQLLRSVFMSWRQAALMVPSTSVSDTLNRMPHRALLAYILKQLRKYTRRLKAAMFKIHPQFRLMKAWNSWQNLRHRLMTAQGISDAVSKTVQAHGLSSVMRQWLYAVTVPASEAEEAIRIKMYKRITVRYFCFFLEFVQYMKEILAMAVEHRKSTLNKVFFTLFQQIVAYRKDLRAKAATAVRNYEMRLMADCFYDVRDDVLEELLVDESVREIVRAKTRAIYLCAGISAFLMLWDEARAFRGRAEDFRRSLDLGLLKVALDAIMTDLKDSKKANEFVSQKYKERNEHAMKNRVFGNWCCAIDNQQRQYLEIEAKIRTTYQRFLWQHVWDAFTEEVQQERERAAKARLQLEFRFKSRAQHQVVYYLKSWVAYSRNLEQELFRKHRVYLMNFGFNQMMMESQQSVDPGLLKQMLRARRHKQLYNIFRGLVSIMNRKQRLYEAHIQARQNTRSRRIKLHWRVWCESFTFRRKRNARLSQLARNNRKRLSRRSLLAWCAVWLQQVYIGNKLVLLRKRFFLLHIKAPAMERWKRFKTDIHRLLVAYYRAVRARTLGSVTRLLWGWKSFVVERGRTLRNIQAMLIHKRCTMCRKVIHGWQRSIDRRIKAGDFSNSHMDACRRKHLQEWRSYCIEQVSVQERARTYHVIIRTSKARRRRETMLHVFTCFAENLFGARSVACSLYRRVKWQHMRAKHGSLLQRAFITWRRHWIEVEQLGEALRRILSQRRIKVDLHHPFWAWVRYVEDRLNIKRETALVHKTAKILTDVLDVYGEPMASDFCIRAERAYTIDDLIKLLRKYQQHHSDLAVAAKLQGAAPPRVVSYGPIPYSHYVTNLGKQTKDDSYHSVGLSPPGAVPVNLSKRAAEDSATQPGVNVSKEYPPGIVVPDRYLRDSPDIRRVTPTYPSAKPSVQRKLENGLGT